MAYNLISPQQRGSQDSVNFTSTEALLASDVQPGAKLEGGVEILGPVRVEEMATIGQGAVLSAGVTIGSEAVVKDGVEMWPGSSTGVNSTLHSRAKVLSGASVGNRTIVAPETSVPANMQTKSWQHISINPRNGQLEEHDLPN